jgi:hypothetical protein
VTTYTVQFKEMGLPTGTSWTVTFNSVGNTGTSSKANFAGIAAGSYYWSITSPVAGAAGVQYVALTTAAYMSVPGQLTEIVQFQKQDTVTFVVSPVSSGATTPSGTPWVVNGTSMAVSATPAVGYSFTKWTSSTASITFASATAASTLATIKAPGTITATFAIVKYHITFYESGLPSRHAWSVVFNGLSYLSSHPLLVVAVQSAGYYSWTAGIPTSGTSIQYAPTPASGAMSVPSQTTQSIAYVEQFQVSFTTSGSGSTTPSGTAFYTNGSQVAIAAQGTSGSPGSKFSAWSANFLALKFGNKANDSTNLTIGAAGTVTATFATGYPCKTATCTLTFYEVGLPKGTSWGITSSSIFYGSTSTSLKISGVANNTYFYWSMVNPQGSSTPGVAYAPNPASSYLYTAYQTEQLIVFTTVDYVNILVGSGSSGTGVGPASGWFPAGSTVAIWGAGSNFAYNFGSWTSNSTKLTFAVAKNSSTFVTVKGPGTIYGNFVAALSKVTFMATGLPTGTVWGVTLNSVLYLGSGTNIVINGVSNAVNNYWYPMVWVAGATTGVAYYTSISSNYISVPYQTLQVIPYVQEFQVTTVASNTGTAVGGAVYPATTAWYQNGTVLFVLAVNGSAGSFSAWSSSSAKITIAGAAQSATTITIAGTGTVTGKFT